MVQTRGMSDADLNKLVWTVLGEAAGESEQGQAAVMHSILNRVQRYGGTPVSIATGGSQRYKTYSAWNHPADGGNNPQNRYPVGSSHFNKVKGVVERVLSGEIADPTGGATHYWSPKGMPGGKDPYWAESESTQYGRHKIGNHVFLPRAGIPGPTPPRDIPNVVASQLDVNQNTASLERMVPMPTGVAEREKARDGIVTVNVSPGVLDQQRRQSQGGSDTFQLDRVVPSPRPRPERDSQTTQQAQERVRLPELAPPGHANVPLPRNDPRRPTRMDLAEEQRGGQSQANPDIFRLDQVVPPAAGMSQRGLTDSEVNQALGLSTDRSKINAKHARNEAAILSQSGTVPPPAPKAVNTTKIVNGMTMPELNELGKLAPHVTDLENVVAEQVKAQQAADQKALADQNTVKTPTPEEAGESNPFAEIGKAISEGLTSLFGGGSTGSDSERAGPMRPSRDGGTNYARDKRLNGGDNSSDRRLPSDGKRYQLNGKEVFAYEATRYNRDTKDFEKYIRYK